MFLVKWLAPWWGQNGLSGTLSIFTAERAAGGLGMNDKHLPSPCPHCPVALSPVGGRPVTVGQEHSASCRPEEGASWEAEHLFRGLPCDPSSADRPVQEASPEVTPRGTQLEGSQSAKEGAPAPVSPMLSSLGLPKPSLWIWPQGVP